MVVYVGVTVGVGLSLEVIVGVTVGVGVSLEVTVGVAVGVEYLYTRTCPLSVPLTPTLYGPPTATTLPSLLRLTLYPLLSSAASPSISLPR